MYGAYHPFRKRGKNHSRPSEEGHRSHILLDHFEQNPTDSQKPVSQSYLGIRDSTTSSKDRWKQSRAILSQSTQGKYIRPSPNRKMYPLTLCNHHHYEPSAKRCLQSSLRASAEYANTSTKTSNGSYVAPREGLAPQVIIGLSIQVDVFGPK